ncbi:MAG: NAD-dependent epimerase/dehydratase family protein, partial [Candidatus Hydrogenedentes bacterium]|nr:NAD-dependent epimerase/dehydratase family protein [Candidatus Hydrogenedentota bacterium]
MTRRALITGAGGFVGQRLSAYLRKEGWEVVCSGHPSGPGILPCDVTDSDSIRTLLNEAGDIGHVFHLGAIAFV